MGAKLLAISGPFRKSEFPLGSELAIGRNVDNAICLEDPAVSAHHCRIELRDGRLILSDLDSHSATEVLEILKRLNEDFHKTVVMVTHDPHAASYAHATRHLEKGMLLPA